MDFNEQQRLARERIENQQFILRLQTENQQFTKDLVASFIAEYSKTNNQLKEINLNLQKQIADTAASAKKSKVKAVISLIVSIVSIVVSSVISVVALCV